MVARVVSRRPLREMPVPKIINFINEVERTGILTVKQVDQWVRIYFKNGEIVDMESSYFPELALSDFIRRRGLVPADQLEKCVEEARIEGKRLGEYLVDKGLISPHQLAEILHIHMISKLLRISGWQDGEFMFEEKAIPPSPHHNLKINIAEIIYQGVKEYLDLPKLPVEFRGRKEQVVYKRLSPRFRLDDLQLTPKESRLYQLIDGTKTLRQLVLLSKMPRKKAYMTLYAFYLLGFISFSEPKPEEVALPEKEKEKEPKEKAGYEIRIDRKLLDEALMAVERAKEAAERAEAEEAPAEEEEAFIIEALEAESEPEPAEAPQEPAPSYQEESWPSEPSIPPPPPVSEPEIEVPEEVAAEEPEEPQEEVEREKLGGVDAEEAAKALSAAEALVRGRDYLEREHYYEALPFLRRAAEGEPDNAEVYPYLGWAMYQTSDKTHADFKEAEEIMKTGIKKDPNLYLSYLYLGKLYEDIGDNEFAKLYFGRALELNPGCREAKEELKRLYMGE